MIIVVEGPSAAGKTTYRDPRSCHAGRPPRSDPARRRRNFDLHGQLAGPLRDWYRTVGQLDPARVRWELPTSGIPGITPGPRDDRTGTDVFDTLISTLPAR